MYIRCTKTSLLNKRKVYNVFKITAVVILVVRIIIVYGFLGGKGW
jgi:hypothetical protein